MKSLISGTIKFTQEDPKRHSVLFESLRNKQNPHTLFVGCSDFRVIPNLITNTGPGGLFIIRDIANIVPPYHVGEDYLATTSTMKYVLTSLQIKDIVVCGHSNRGECNAFYSSEGELEKVPNVKKWSTMLESIGKDILLFSDNNLAMRSWLTEKPNLVNSLQNILTYPGIGKVLNEGKVEVHTWYYTIETGEIYEYDFEAKTFTLIQNRRNV